MTESDETVWDRALSALFGDGMFAAIGPRRHDDWRRDVMDAMGVRTREPGGRLRITKVRPRAASDTEGPFASVTPAHFDRVYEVSGRGAAQILVTLQGEWFSVAGIPDAETKKGGLLSHARALLGRFGEGARYFTNISAARGDPDADMFERDSAYEGFTEYAMDCGLVVVSASEVGVFWSFLET
jgi:hypothetical protein